MLVTEGDVIIILNFSNLKHNSFKNIIQVCLQLKHKITLDIYNLHKKVKIYPNALQIFLFKKKLKILMPQ